MKTDDAGPSELIVDDLRISYGRSQAVRGISLSVPKGSCIGMVGANGAGKSSAFRAIAGLTPIESGTIRVGDRNLAGMSAARRARLGIRLVPESKELFRGLTVRENLDVGARLLDRGERALVIGEVVDIFPRLAERWTSQAGNLSGGEQQMLAIGRALASRPNVLLLDEPALGLAPNTTKAMIQALHRIRATGLSILIAEQTIALPQSLCDEVHVVALGSIVASGPPAHVLNPDTLGEAFLGRRPTE